MKRDLSSRKANDGVAEEEATLMLPNWYEKAELSISGLKAEQKVSFPKNYERLEHAKNSWFLAIGLSPPTDRFNRPRQGSA